MSPLLCHICVTGSAPLAHAGALSSPRPGVPRVKMVGDFLSPSLAEVGCRVDRYSPGGELWTSSWSLVENKNDSISNTAADPAASLNAVGLHRGPFLAC